MASVKFNYANVRSISLKNKKSLQKFIVMLFEKEGKPLEGLNYVFCSDLYLLEINKHFLKHDYYTDIITFNLSEGKGIVGEIYISVERVMENSKEYKIKYTNELLRVIFHGALHLCGYKDKKKSEILLMKEKEEYYLRLIKETSSLCFT